MDKGYPIVLLTFLGILVFSGVLVLGQYCDSNVDCWDAWDVGDLGDYSTIAGYCTQLRDRCNLRLNVCRGNDIYTDFIESCSGDTLTEYYATGYPTYSCLSTTYNCDSFSQCARVICLNPPCDPCPGNNCKYEKYSCKGAGTTADPGYCDFDYTDLDVSSSYCDACENDNGWSVNWRRCGETFGDCTAGQNDCCGDDNNENRIDSCSVGGTNNPESFSCSGTTTLCCNNANDCTDEGGCYPSGVSGGCKEDALCDGGNTWFDQDSQSGRCSTCQGSGKWQLGGEASSAGDQCCGDDSSEYRRTCVDSSAEGNCGSDTVACCTANNKCVDQNGGCRNSGRCIGTNVFGNSYCNAGTWEDPDESSSYCDSTCDRTSGDDGIAYNIGGETTSGDCCGNNNNEYVITEQGGTDAPGGFGNGITTCCDPGTDCTFNDNCVARGDIRANNNNRYAWCCHTNEESCSANTWYGGDAYLSACIDIVGSGFWNIGFETGTNGNCCGDDSSEYKRTCVDSSAEGNCGSDTEECCTANNKCVDQNGGCRNSGSCHGSTAFGNSYCNAGTWEDPDESSSYCVSSCDLTSGDDGIAYNIDGETTSGDCCGNNNNEYVITEQSGGTDSPSGYNDGITTCCNPGTDCTHDDTCTAAGDDDGSAWCCSTGEESCSANTWYGPDDYQSACNDLVGLNRWSLGGELAATTCCGDDSNEYSITCQDGLGGSGACADSTDDFACCNANTDCVYNNFCYSDQDLTPDSNWICLSGTWIRLGITVVINATPTTATTVWQNTSATASVYCTTPAASIQCDANSYRLHISTTSISTCPTDYNNDYSPPGTQTVSSHSWVCGAAKDTLNNEGFSDPVEFLVDQIAPTASLNPLPTWTNQSSVTVDWSGSDTGGSGIWRFDLHYRITDIYGSVIQGWTWWANPTSNPGSRTFLNMTNNRTYQFRIRARDNAGNIGGWSASESISVDLVDPTCQMANLPMYTTSSSFVVSWSGSDGESGIQYYDVQVRVGAGSWGYLNDPDGYHTTEIQDNVNGADGNTYYFRCRSYDNANNMGIWSAIKNTTVDATPPVSSVDPLPPWLNLTSFTVSWNGSDGTSGIDCYDIQFDDGSGWGDWFTCTQTLSSTFGPGSPVNVTDNVTYSFRSRATDNAGNIEGWPPQPDTYTTIDLTPPQYDLRAYDQNGREISGYVQGVSTVIISSVATDSTSGVMNNYIHYILLNDLGETIDSQDCGPAYPYGGVSECNMTVDFSGAITLEYWVEVIDRAGNMVISEVFYIGTHPLANFREHNIYLSVGEITTIGVQVRNMQNQVDNVTITLSSTLPVAPYFLWVDDPDVEISGSNNETLIVSNINPGATPPPFNVILWSADTANIYQVTLNAFSALNISDSDQAAVKIGYPASFPGLNEWAIFVLIILAVFGYVWFGREMR